MLNVACFVQSRLTDADFVIFSNYCLIGTRRKVCGFCDAYDAEKVHLQRICLTGCAGRACTLRRVGMTWVCYDSDDERQLAEKAKEAAEL